MLISKVNSVYKNFSIDKTAMKKKHLTKKLPRNYCAVFASRFGSSRIESYSSMMPRGGDIRSLTGLSSMLTYTVINLVSQAVEKDPYASLR